MLLTTQAVTHNGSFNPQTNHMKKLKYIAPVLIAIACFGLQQAKADVFKFQLSQGNPALTGGGFTGPYANGTVTTNGTNVATITFTSLTQTVNGTSYIYLFGDGSSVAVNASAASTIGGFVAATLPGFSAPQLSDGGAGNVDGFGTMNHTVNNFDGFSHATNSITFTLTKTNGNWGAANMVLTPNSQNAFAGGHIFVTLNPPNQANGAAVTGFAANGGGFVPDGGTTVMLLGMALGALGVVRRYLTS
jgi:protein with PEP-CTERM/exosortase system signal